MPSPSALEPYWATTDDKTAVLYHGDVREVLRAMPRQSVHCVVTSPPYWALRDYKTGSDKELGSERTPEEYVANMVEVFRLVRRVLREDGTLWLNLGDTYASSGENRNGKSSKTLDKKSAEQINCRRANHGVSNPGATCVQKGNLLGIPWRVALALQSDGWILRSDIPWIKRSAMPESVTNRPAKALEYVFLLTKRPNYFFDMEAVKREATRAGDVAGGQKYRSDAFNATGMGRHSDSLAGTVPDARNFRNADLWFDSLDAPHGLCGIGDEIVGVDATTKGYPGAHYATFPPMLIDPFIRAGTSAKGCCSNCGKPWVRVVEPDAKTKAAQEKARNGQDWYARGYDNSNKKGKGVKYGDKPAAGFKSTYETKAWEPQCSCDATVIPCTVLDPFIGSGTTVEVCIKHKKRGIGIDLHRKYLDENAIPRVCNAICRYRPTKTDLIPD